MVSSERARGSGARQRAARHSEQALPTVIRTLSLDRRRREGNKYVAKAAKQHWLTRFAVGRLRCGRMLRSSLAHFPLLVKSLHHQVDSAFLPLRVWLDRLL